VAEREELSRIDCIESLIQEDAGRNVQPLFAHTRGGLRRAALSLSGETRPNVAILTGFFVPDSTPPAAETDGPPAAALVASGLIRAGVPCRIFTDAHCAAACAAAVSAAGLDPATLLPLPLDGAGAALSRHWQSPGVTHALAIERCGRSADGRPRNMRGEDIGAVTPLLDDEFAGGAWVKIAIADGGNELGAGSLPREAVAAHVANGAQIACTTRADHLILAGVSHWGAYALLAGLAVLRADWAEGLVGCLDADLDLRILEATVRNGPAVDGVTRQQTVTIDGIAPSQHRHKLDAIRALVADGHTR
jgi:D-glutamate cyclase